MECGEREREYLDGVLEEKIIFGDPEWRCGGGIHGSDGEEGCYAAVVLNWGIARGGGVLSEVAVMTVSGGGGGGEWWW